PLATVVTPNLDEVRLISGVEVTDHATARKAAEALHALGPRWVVVKGGHLRSSQVSTDLLFDGHAFHEFTAPRIPTGNDHGGGDTLAAALACALAHGYQVPDALAFAKEWTRRCLEAAYDLGAGHGPVSPLWRLHHSCPPKRGLPERQLRLPFTRMAAHHRVTTPVTRRDDDRAHTRTVLGRLLPRTRRDLVRQGEPVVRPRGRGTGSRNGARPGLRRGRGRDLAGRTRLAGDRDRHLRHRPRARRRARRR